MADTVAIMLGEGFEPVEALAPYDILTRGGCDVTFISVMDDLEVESSVGARVMADMLVGDADLHSYTLLVIPGGSLGVQNLGKCEPLAHELRNRMKSGALVGAICAGPMILADLDLLQGRAAVCYPGCQGDFPEGVYRPDLDVCIDGNLVTATGPGTALAFGRALLHAVKGQAAAASVAADMLMA